VSKTQPCSPTFKIYLSLTYIVRVFIFGAKKKAL